MKCTFCDHELTAELIREQGCGSCLGGCRKIHCPYCGQENPITSEFIDKLLGCNPASGEKERKK